MKKELVKILSLLCFISGCATLEPPADYSYKVIKTKDFDIVSWQKITNPKAPYKFYIEGDGHAFNAHGMPTQDPTPKGTLVRELAFGDPNPNVVYLARPCQYQKSSKCAQKYWTTARFSQEVIDSEYQAIKQIAGPQEVVLVGFSGGGLVASLVAATKEDIKVKKLITIAGNLDHVSWITYHKLLPLTESMNLADYREQFDKIPQLHYVGEKDKVVPKTITEKFINDSALIKVVPKASHAENWEAIYPEIRQE